MPAPERPAEPQPQPRRLTRRQSRQASGAILDELRTLSGLAGDLVRSHDRDVSSILKRLEAIEARLEHLPASARFREEIVALRAEAERLRAENAALRALVPPVAAAEPAPPAPEGKPEVVKPATTRGRRTAAEKAGTAPAGKDGGTP